MIGRSIPSDSMTTRVATCWGSRLAEELACGVAPIGGRLGGTYDDGSSLGTEVGAGEPAGPARAGEPYWSSPAARSVTPAAVRIAGMSRSRNALPNRRMGPASYQRPLEVAAGRPHVLWRTAVGDSPSVAGDR